MDLNIVSAVVGLIAVVVLVIGSRLIVKLKGSSSQKDRLVLEQQIKEGLDNISQTAQRSSGFASKGQLDYLTQQIETEGAALISEREKLKSIEAKLDASQKHVEEKESHQQEIKTAKEEDEIKLADLSNNFADISAQSVSLEQMLASSLKNLDSLIQTLQLTDAQKAAFVDLSGALSSSGERMRDLITEYQGLNERIELLKSQHDDLETEYTKLVEKQLGE